MNQSLLQLSANGLPQCQAVLARELPDLDPGLVALTPRRALLPASTLRSLRARYGRQGCEAVLREAGVQQHDPISNDQALRLVRQTRLQPPAAQARRRSRQPPVAPGRGARTCGLAAALGGPEAIAWGAVRVGQIDTGYTRHPALGFPDNTWVDVAGGRTWFNPGEGGGSDGPGLGVDNNDRLRDGHGTRVASVICGDHAAAPGGRYLGVAPRVPLVPVRIADDVLIPHAQRELAQAIRYLVREARVSVINLSMGFLPRSQIKVLDQAIDEAYESGVILVCAAGQPLPRVVSPAHGRRTLAVAGSTPAGIPWGQSAHGNAVNWTAPAADILRADTNRQGQFGYAGNGDGTSYAAAISTGAAALWLARHGEAALKAAYPSPWQRVAAFQQVAEATAKPMPHQQQGSFGFGILDITDLLATPLPPAGSLQPQGPA